MTKFTSTFYAYICPRIKLLSVNGYSCFYDTCVRNAFILLQLCLYPDVTNFGYYTSDLALVFILCTQVKDCFYNCQSLNTISLNLLLLLEFFCHPGLQELGPGACQNQLRAPIILQGCSPSDTRRCAFFNSIHPFYFNCPDVDKLIIISNCLYNIAWLPNEIAVNPPPICFHS